MINIENLTFNFPNIKTASVVGQKTIEGGGYFNKISNKSLKYSGASPSFDFLNVPLYDSSGTQIKTLNLSHFYPQQGVLDEKTGFYYSYIGSGESSDKAYIKIAGITLPYNRTLGRLIKWRTTINGTFEYVGQVVLLGLSHQNLSIYDGKLFVTGTNSYHITSSNTLDSYKDLRCFLIPLDEFNFANPVTDENVLAIPAIGNHFGASYKGKTISTDYMFDKSPDYNDNGDPVYVKNVTGPQWIYGLADSSHIFTSNGNNLYFYNIDLQNKRFISVNKELSNNINLGNSIQVYSTDKNRIESNPLSDNPSIPIDTVNDYYMIKGRHVQSMTVRNNHLYVTLGGVSYAHSIENVMAVKIIDLATGMLIGEIDVESLVEKYGAPVPTYYNMYTGVDSENNVYRALTNGKDMLVQELEDIYVAEDESFIIIGHILSNPKYFKVDLAWNY